MEVPAGYGHMVIGYTHEGDPDIMINNFGVFIPDPPTVGDLENLLDAWQTCWSPWVSSVVDRSITRITLSPDDGGTIVEIDQTGTAFGNTGTAALPTSSAYICRKSAAIGGRAHRGRVFVPGVLIANVTDQGNLTPGTISGINADLEVFLSTFPHGNINSLQLLHENPATAPDLITQLSVSNRLAVMKNRYIN